VYFHYYGMLQHQQNMMQDATRTGTYFWAIMSNLSDFEGKVVVDVGAGSGILSLFAAQVCQPAGMSSSAEARHSQPRLSLLRLSWVQLARLAADVPPSAVRHQQSELEQSSGMGDETPP
jgi:tRNA A58 N-methylase Trm61